MTEALTKDLVLAALDELYKTFPDILVGTTAKRAIDRIKAQAARIAELERELWDYKNGNIYGE